MMMDFIGQVALSDVPSLPANLRSSGSMAYIFMSNHERADRPDDLDTWDPESGENAVIVQPGGSAIVTTVDDVEITRDDLPAEFSVRLTLREEPEFLSDEGQPGVIGYELYSPEGDKLVHRLLKANKLGGVPCFVQHVTYPPSGGPWLFMLQIHNSAGFVEANYGSGTAHVFVSEDGTEGRMLWQC